ncbi:MAG: fumarylacetoacetate hydrolase family protein [Planctomycetota bacterium]
MRLATVDIRGKQKLVLCFDGLVFDIERVWNDHGKGFFRIDLGMPKEPPATTMTEYLRGGTAAYETMRRFHDIVRGIWYRDQRTALLGATFREEEVKWYCPVPRPPMLIHIGENYPRLYRQQPLGTAVPAVPAYDVVPSYITAAHLDPLVIPKEIEHFGGHGEIGCIVGGGGRNISIEEARDHIAGFLCVLDFHGPVDSLEGVDTKKVTRAETLALAQLIRMRTASQPMGPYLTTPEEVGDPYDCLVNMKLNDQSVCRYWSNVIVHGFERTISHLSQFMTILPGMIIQLGMMSSYSIGFHKDDRTPANAFFGVEIERVGYLKSPIVDERGL